MAGQGLCFRFKQVSWIDLASVQVNRWSQAPLSDPRHLTCLWINLRWLQSSFATLRSCSVSLRQCRALHSRNITPLSGKSCLWDSTELALCLHLTSYSHICHLKSHFFVLHRCPPSLPWRLQQQPALPRAIFDYMLLGLNLQETGVLIQGDTLLQEMAGVSDWN